MSAKEVSIAVYDNKVDALANAQNMSDNGFEVSPVLEVSDAINWNNFTARPAVTDDANTPAWMVIGRR